MSQPYDYFAARPAPSAPFAASPVAAVAPVGPVAPPRGLGPAPLPPPGPVAARAGACPGAVVGAAVLGFVQAGVLAVGGVGALYLATRLDAASAPAGAAALALGVLVALATVGLLRARRWAAPLLGVLEAAALAGGLWGIARGGGDVGDWLRLGFAAGVVVLLLAPEARAWATSRR